MPDLEVLGVDTGIERARLPLILGIAAVALLVVFRRPAGASSLPAGGSLDQGAAAEFARVTAASRQDLAQLAAATGLEQQRLANEFANSPAGLRTCYSQAQWQALGQAERKAIRSQAGRGGSVLQAGPGGGICVTPSGRGISGDLEAVQRARSGLFGGSSVGIGAAAPPAPRPGLIDLAGLYYGR